jgi:hypothetical protein
MRFIVFVTIMVCTRRALSSRFVITLDNCTDVSASNFISLAQVNCEFWCTIHEMNYFAGSITARKRTCPFATLSYA